MFFSFGSHLSICTKECPFHPYHPIHGFLLVFFFSLYFTGLIFLEITSLFISLNRLIQNFDRDGLHLEELANTVQTKLHAYKADDPAGMGEVRQGHL